MSNEALENYKRASKIMRSFTGGLETLIPLKPITVEQYSHQFWEMLGNDLCLFLQSCIKAFDLNSASVRDFILDNQKDESIRELWSEKFEHEAPYIFRGDAILKQGEIKLTEIDQLPPNGAAIASGARQVHHFICDGGNRRLQLMGRGVMEEYVTLLQNLSLHYENNVVFIFPRSVEHLYNGMKLIAENCRKKNYSVHVAYLDELTVQNGQLLYSKQNSNSYISVDMIIRGYYLHELEDLGVESKEVFMKPDKFGIRCTPHPRTEWLHSELWISQLRTNKKFFIHELGEERFDRIDSVFAKTRTIGETPAPLPSLRWFENNGHSKEACSVEGWDAKFRSNYVIKNSTPDSPLSWGSKGVLIGKESTTKKWKQHISSDGIQTLQEWAEPRVEMQRWYDPKTEEICSGEVVTGIRPIYIRNDNKARLADLMLVQRPANETIIHGSSNSIISIAGFKS